MARLADAAAGLRWNTAGHALRTRGAETAEPTPCAWKNP
jgi:hypothetical protein